MFGSSFKDCGLNRFYHAPNTGAGNGGSLSIPLAPKPDAIMLASATYNSDLRIDGKTKFNLGIGVCSDSKGTSEVPGFIKAIQISVNRFSAKYLPGTGDAKFLEGARKLIFGSNLKEQNQVGVLEFREDKFYVKSVQSAGGTNALFNALSTLQKANYGEGEANPYKNADVYVSNPTWGNHKNISDASGFKSISNYPYLSDDGMSVDFDKLLTFIDSIEKSSVLILHAACHNPTGSDLTVAQWDLVINKIKEKQSSGINLMPVFDTAYQGFGKGIDEDVYSIRKAAELGLDFIVAESYSKKFSLYAERLGATHFCSSSKELVEAYQSTAANIVIRSTNSNMPSEGTRVANQILHDVDMLDAYSHEMSSKRDHFEKVRTELGQAIGMNLTNSNGMFVFVPVSDLSTREALWNDHGIMTVPLSWIDSQGITKHALRICIDPITDCNKEQIFNGFREVFK
jgi:aromatic-amino-acid transaminase